MAPSASSPELSLSLSREPLFRCFGRTRRGLRHRGRSSGSKRRARRREKGAEKTVTGKTSRCLFGSRKNEASSNRFVLLFFDLDFFSFGLFLCKTTRQLIVQARARAPLSLSRSLDRSTMRIAASTLRAPHQQQQRAAGSSSDGAALPLRSSRKVGNAAASIIDRRRARCVAGYF